MAEFERKVLEHFPGKVVRKDLTTMMKSGLTPELSAIF